MVIVEWVKAGSEHTPARLWPGVRKERPAGGARAMNDAEEDAEALLSHVFMSVATGRMEHRRAAYVDSGIPVPSDNFLMREVLGRHSVTDAHMCAEWIRLPGGHLNWIVDLLIARLGSFYSHGAGDWYLDARGFLEHADRRDLANTDLVLMARRAVEMEERRLAGRASRGK